MTQALTEAPVVLAFVPTRGTPVSAGAPAPARTGVVDALLLLGVVFSIPVAILLAGLPIVLVLQIVLRLARLL